MRLRYSYEGLLPLLLLPMGCLHSASAQGRSRPPAPTPFDGDTPSARVPPLPSVDLFGDGTLRTDGVNRLTCRARVGATEWLGTHQGLKRLDTKTKRVRYITRRDGLPGDYIEAVAADDKGVFAVVRDAKAPFHVFFGTLNPTTLRWKTLGESTARSLEGSYSLALTPSKVVLASPAVAWHQDAFLTVLERSSQTLRTLPWDEALRADHEGAALRFVTVRNGIAWVGTDLGLLSVPLSGSPTWSRYLPEQSCMAAEWSPTGTLWLVTHPRAAPRTNQWDPNPPAEPRELAVQEWNPTTQRVTHEAKVPLQPTEQTFPPQKWFETSLALAGNDLWLTRAQEGLLHYDPKARTWQTTAFPAQGEQRIPPHVGQVLAKVAPEAAVLPYVLTRLAPTPTDGRRPYGNAFVSPDYWLYRRFPDWLTGSPQRTALTKPPPVDKSVVPIEDWARFGRLVDPQNPELVWASEGNALLLVDKENVPAIHRGADNSSFGTAGFSRVEAKRFPASLGAKSVSLPVGMLGTFPDNTLVVLTGQGLFQTEGSGARKLAGNLDFSNNQAVVAGPQGSLFVRGSEGLLRWDASSQSLLPVATAPEASRYSLKAGTPRGLLFQESHSVLWLQELDAHDRPKGTLTRVELPEAIFQRAVGNTLWCLKNSGECVGYNLVTRRWSTPLKLTESGYTGANPFLSLGGQAYYVSEAKEGALLRYNEREDRWETVVPAVPERHHSGLSLAALTEDEALFADRNRAWRYDRRKERWAPLELPEAIRLNAAAPFTRCSALRPEGFYLGGERGLWRYLADAKRWEEVRGSLAGSEGQKLFLHLRSVDASAVWGEVQGNGNPAPRFVFRFDKQTHGFTYYDESAGVPHAYSFQQVADGTGYWFATNEGAWRLSTTTGKCTQLTTEAVQTIQADPFTPGAVYLLSRQGELVRYDTQTGQSRTLDGPPLVQGTALLIEREQVLVCADARLFAVQKTSGVWKPIRLPADQPPLAAYHIKRTAQGHLLLSDYSRQNQIEVKR